MATSEARDATVRMAVAIGLPALVFAFILGGAVSLKKAKAAGRLKAEPGVNSPSDGVDRMLALGGLSALAAAGCWLVGRHIAWLRAKSAQVYARLEAEHARAEAARAERAAAREQRRAQRASRAAEPKGYYSPPAADELIERMRSATATAWQWLRSAREPLAPGAHVPSSAPVRPSRGPAGGVRGAARSGRGGAPAASAPRWSAKRAEVAAAALGGGDEDLGAFEAALNAPGGGARASAEADEAEEEVEEEEEEEEEDEEDDEEEEEEDAAVRVPLDLTPAEEGTRIELGGLTASAAVASVQLATLALALRCTACAKGFSISVTLSALDGRAHEVRAWCEACAALLSATLRPALLAPVAGGGCGALAHVDTVDCAVVDVLPSSELLCTCLACDAETALRPLQRGRRAEADCRGCHARLAFCAREIRLERLSARSAAADGSGGRRPRAAGRAGGDGAKAFDAELRTFRADAARTGGVPTFRVGEPLPRSGTCEHFGKSLRWLRFQCCGRALPCPVCHERSGCPAAELGVRATAMICGLCSREQPFSNGRCECGAEFARAFSAHWQGGAGCRDAARLSRKDARKHHGAAKTASNKANRVGARGRDARAQPSS